jgi:hypothetical protein
VRADHSHSILLHVLIVLTSTLECYAFHHCTYCWSVSEALEPMHYSTSSAPARNVEWQLVQFLEKYFVTRYVRKQLDRNVSEEHAASIFSIEISFVRIWWPYRPIGKLARTELPTPSPSRGCASAFLATCLCKVTAWHPEGDGSIFHRNKNTNLQHYWVAQLNRPQSVSITSANQD